MAKTIICRRDSYCPCCDSDNIYNERVYYSIDAVHVTCICESCGSKFTFNYYVESADIPDDDDK